MGILGGIFIGFIFKLINASQFNHSHQNLFCDCLQLSVLPGMIPWFVILLAELRFRRHNQDMMKDHPFKFAVNIHFSNYFAFLMCSNCYSCFNSDTNFSNYRSIGINCGYNCYLS